ncbi:MAG: B12-binding domain-containing protein [Chloroflexota bacterium]|nr:B12-binding domain-containing protein [Chloroflexota bacterium]
MPDLDLSQFSDTPLFNTKAVVQETGVSAATLRAWERRYGVPNPERTESNYRLYSERDIALIRWLRERVEGGISISQAVELYRRMQEGEDVPTEIPGEPRRPTKTVPHDQESSKHRLIEAFKAFDEQRADQILNELFALYSIEEVLSGVITPTMIEIGEQWHRGEVSVPVEHFSTAYIERKLMALMNVQPTNLDAPLIVTGCAPHEQHELGVLLFSLFLRRNGLRVLYLGQNVPLVDLRATLESLKPSMLALSAATREPALKLEPISKMIEEMSSPRPLFVYGGAAFQQEPELRRRISGIYLGDDAQSAARDVLRHIDRK